TGLTKVGTGTLVVSHPVYTGSTSIAAGTLQLGSGTSALTSLPTSGIVDNGTLIIANPSGATLSYGKTISGMGGLTVTGAGILNLSGANTYTGLTQISGGAVN